MMHFQGCHDVVTPRNSASTRCSQRYDIPHETGKLFDLVPTLCQESKCTLPLYYAALSERHDVVKCLTPGEDFNLVDNDGETAGQLAAHRGHHGTVGFFGFGTHTVIPRVELNFE